VNVAAGPFATAGVTAAMPPHVLLSVNVPVSPLSDAPNVSAYDGPVPIRLSAAGETISACGVAVGDGTGVGDDAVGAAVRAAVGFADGALDGPVDGDDDGAPLGALDGIDDADAVGAVVGDALALDDGDGSVSGAALPE
jgi:hypothetical protein